MTDDKDYKLLFEKSRNECKQLLHEIQLLKEQLERLTNPGKVEQMPIAHPPKLSITDKLELYKFFLKADKISTLIIGKRLTVKKATHLLAQKTRKRFTL